MDGSGLPYQRRLSHRRRRTYERSHGAEADLRQFMSDSVDRTRLDAEWERVFGPSVVQKARRK